MSKPVKSVSAPPPVPAQQKKRGRAEPPASDASDSVPKRARADTTFGALNKLNEIVRAALDLNKKSRFNHKNSALTEEQLSKPITKDSFEEWDTTIGQNIVHGLKLFMIGSGNDNRAYVELPKALEELDVLRKQVQAKQASESNLQAKLEERDKTIKDLNAKIEELEKPAANAARLVEGL